MSAEGGTAGAGERQALLAGADAQSPASVLLVYRPKAGEKRRIAGAVQNAWTARVK